MLKRTSWTASFSLVLLLCACGMDRLAAPDGHRAPKHTACVTCHRTAAPDSMNSANVFAGGMDPSAACMDCHHYEEGHHPVNMALGSGRSTRPVTGLPLFDGKVRCLTCHQAHADAGKNDMREPQHLLRGAPYADIRTFCAACHDQERSMKTDPHRMKEADGSISTIDGRPVCLFCHRERPEADADPDEVTFRADVAFLCWRCHASMKGTFLGGHLLARPKKDVRRTMRRTEAATGIDLPLARDGMITCSTCHNPHQQGVLARTTAQAGADQPGRLRMPKASICSSCHA